MYLLLALRSPHQADLQHFDMPRFLVYAPDYPGVLETRMAVRAEHKVRAQPDVDQGINGRSRP
jgi:hypothetical protein